MTAYRENANACPACGAALREFHDRLVCDDCNGMLIGADDFAASLRDLDGKDEPITASELDAAGKKCPGCDRELQHAKLARGKATLWRGLWCEHDGLWAERDAMVATFARVERRGGSHGGRRYETTGPGGGMNAALGSIREAFGSRRPASAALAISQPHRRPLVHTAFVSAFAGVELGCPACAGEQLAFEIDRWTCARCAGSFVEDAALVAMVSEMTNAPWELPRPSGEPSARTCPRCAAAMTTETFEGVTIERCAGHGAWFDERELATALHHAAQPESTGGWLRRLFT